MRPGAALAIAVVAVLAGCVTPPSATDEPAASVPAVAFSEILVLEDPSGDAWTASGFVVRDGVQNWCPRFPVGPPLRERCAEATAAATPPDVGVVEAPPWLDILGVSIAEDESDLVFAIEVASLPEDPSEILVDDKDANWEVCWDEVVPDSCDFGRAAQHAAFSFGGVFGSAPQMSATFQTTWNKTGTFGCNDWWWCMWAIPFELQPGTPGRIVLRVPRDLLNTPHVLGNVEAKTWLSDHRLDGPVNGVSYAGPGPAPGEVWGMPWWWRWYVYSVDRVDATAEYAVRGPDPAPPPPGTAAPGSYFAASEDSPLRPRGLRISETPDDVTLSVLFEEVPDPFAGAWFEAELAFETGRLVYVWYDAREQGATPGAWMCSDEECERYLAVPVQAIPVSDEDPRIDLVFPRVAIGSPGAGTRTNLVEVDGSVVLRRADAGAQVDDQAGLWFTLAPYTFTMDTGAPDAAGRSTIVQDGTGDVIYPPTAAVDPRWRAEVVDITYVDVEPAGEGSIRISLGLEGGLGTVEPPATFDAILYSVALAVPDRPTLVGYYRAEDEEAGTFFCAEDTLILAGEGRLPPRDFWQTIEGVLSTTDTDGQGRSRVSGGGGSIVYTMPLACLGDDTGKTLTADAVAAVTMAFRTRTDESRTLDEASADGPFAVETAVAAPAAPWYVRPFGLDNFWDMFGIAAAVLTTGVGAALVQRRRSSLRRLLAEVERAGGLSHGAEREAALRALRGRVKEDLARGRISEGHYVLVERRLDELLARARVQALAEAFDELPHGLLERLQAMLADGTMTADDHRVFSALVEKARFLTPEAKREICERAAAWVRQDATPPPEAS